MFYMKNNQGKTLKYKKYVNEYIKIIHLGAKNNPVGWNG